MMKNISKKDINLIAVYDGVLYEYHDGSWNERESWRTDDELKGERLNVGYLYKDTNKLKSIPKLIITTSELPRVTPGNEALMQRFMSIPFAKVSEEGDVRKES